MAEVRPFRGVHYNRSLLKDWASVICPVYDIITPQQQQELYLKSECNFVHLEFSREMPQDTATDNKYTRAAAALEQWLKQDILEVDEKPAIYLHDQYYPHQGKECKRRGITVRVRLEEWDKKVVRPHEGTTAEPKSDRLSLLWALQANTCPVLAMYEDKGQQISNLLAILEKSKPLIDLEMVGGEGHKVWAITEPGVINQISDRLAGEPIYIADGHHRYESALAYQRERLTCSPSASREEAFDFVMMTLVDFSDRGLLILPPHRLVRGIPKSTLNGFMDKLKAFFEIEEVPLSNAHAWKQVDDLIARTDGTRITLFGIAPGRLFVLKVRDLAAVSKLMPYFHSDIYNELDVSIIDHVILENLLALRSEQEKSSLGYSYDRQDAVNRVLAQEYQLAFLLSPIKAEVIKAIADVGDKMPRKSTYFYPKVPAGLVFNRLV